VRPPETRLVTCPYCGAKQSAVITRHERAKDQDWDDGACLQCSAPIISERCGSTSLIRSPETSTQTTQAADEARGRKRMRGLRRLVHLQHFHPLAAERRKALIDEARRARDIATRSR
jgi:hypothetical protein